MIFRSRGGYQGDGFLGLPPMIGQLLLINLVVFLAQGLLPGGMLYRGIPMVPNGFALVPSQVLTSAIECAMTGKCPNPRPS